MTIEQHTCTDRCHPLDGKPVTIDLPEGFWERFGSERVHKRGQRNDELRRSPWIKHDPEWIAPKLATIPDAFDYALPSGPGCYMAVDKWNQPIYIGAAAVVTARIGAHCARSPWRADVVRWRVWPCATRSEALRLERLLIQLYRPPHNLA